MHKTRNKMTQKKEHKLEIHLENICKNTEALIKPV